MIKIDRMNQNPTSLSPKRNILIIFDLDETLIYATKVLLDRIEDFRIGDYYVFKRPFLDSVVVNLSQYFSLAVWSSGTEDYVKDITEKLMSTGVKFEFIWSRANCTVHFDKDYNDYFYIKKIDKVRKLGFAKEKILIIEDQYQNVHLNYGNAIIVKPFRGDDDNELLSLCNYLLTFKDTQNVLNIDKRNWQTKMISPDDLK
jgi:carboxy-terminal domain RNA polymerase II polypeptide A small phosphatase